MLLFIHRMYVHKRRNTAHTGTKTIISKCMLNTTWHLKFLELHHSIQFKHTNNRTARTLVHCHFSCSAANSVKIYSIMTTKPEKEKTSHSTLRIVHSFGVHLVCSQTPECNFIAIYHSFRFEIRARELYLNAFPTIHSPRPPYPIATLKELQFTNFLLKRDTSTVFRSSHLTSKNVIAIGPTGDKTDTIIDPF